MAYLWCCSIESGNGYLLAVKTAVEMTKALGGLARLDMRYAFQHIHLQVHASIASYAPMACQQIACTSSL